MTADSHEPDDLLVTPQDFLAALRGTADAQTKERVRRALDRPESDVRKWVDGVQDWAARSLPLSEGQGFVADRMISESAAAAERERVVLFMRRKRQEGILTDIDLSRVLAAGAIDPDAKPHPSASVVNIATTRMLMVAAGMHPELTREIAATFQNPQGPTR